MKSFFNLVIFLFIIIRSAVLDEVNVFDEKNVDTDAPQEKSRIKDHRKTKMLKGILVFEEFLHKLEGTFKCDSPTKNERISLDF